MTDTEIEYASVEDPQSVHRFQDSTIPRTHVTKILNINNEEYVLHQ